MKRYDQQQRFSRESFRPTQAFGVDNGNGQVTEFCNEAIDVIEDKLDYLSDEKLHSGVLINHVDKILIRAKRSGAAEGGGA